MDTVLSSGLAARFARMPWENVSTDTIIQRAIVNLGTSGLGMATHFHEESALMLHLMRGIPHIPVIHICEPLRPVFMDTLMYTYGPNLHLFTRRPHETKRQTLQRAVFELSLDGVFFGIHRYQSDNRETKELVEYDDEGPRPFCRIHPLLNWAPKWVGTYFKLHGLPCPEGHAPGTRIQEEECGLHCSLPKQASAA